MLLNQFDFLLIFFSSRVTCSLDSLKNFSEDFRKISNKREYSVNNMNSVELYEFFRQKSLNSYFKHIEHFPDFSQCKYVFKEVYGNDIQKKDIETINKYIIEPQKKNRDVFNDFTCLAYYLWGQYIDMFVVYVETNKKDIPDSIQNFMRAIKDKSLDQQTLYLKEYFDQSCTGIFQKSFL